MKRSTAKPSKARYCGKAMLALWCTLRWFFSREAMNPVFKVISLFSCHGCYFKHVKTLQGRETQLLVAFVLWEARFRFLTCRRVHMPGLWHLWINNSGIRTNHFAVTNGLIYKQTSRHHGPQVVKVREATRSQYFSASHPGSVSESF